MSGTDQRPEAAGNRALNILGWLVVALGAVGAYLTLRGWDLARSRVSGPVEQGWVAYTPLPTDQPQQLSNFELVMPDLGVVLLAAAVAALIALLTLQAWHRELR